LVLNNRFSKSDMGFRLVPKSVTMNGIMAVILHNSTEFSRFGGQLGRSA